MDTKELFEPADSTDSAFAESVRKYREEAGLSQGALAQEMVSRGHKFHQTTINKIETDDRRVSVGEATDLADILNVPLSVMTFPDPRSPAVAIHEMRSAAEALQEKDRRIVSLLEGAIQDQERLKAAVDQVDALFEGAGDAHVQAAARGAHEHAKYWRRQAEWGGRVAFLNDLDAIRFFPHPPERSDG